MQSLTLVLKLRTIYVELEIPHLVFLLAHCFSILVPPLVVLVWRPAPMAALTVIGVTHVTTCSVLPALVLRAAALLVFLAPQAAPVRVGLFTMLRTMRA
jgi:hypothetical protein